MKKADIQTLITRWIDAGIINQEQASHMMSDVGEVTSENSGNKFISAIMIIGATALSLGALLIIASNWAGFSKGVKLFLTIILPIIPLSFAYWQLVVKNSEKVLGRAANILGMVLIGGSLALVGQIYHLEANMVSFLWMWVLLSTPFTFIYKKPENVFFSATLIGFALLFWVVDFLETSGISDSRMTIVFTITTLLYGYILYTLGSNLRNSGVWSRSSKLLRIGGAAVVTIMLFIMTFEEYAKSLVEWTYRSETSWELLSFGLNILFIGFLVFAILRSIRYEEYSLAFSFVRFFGFYLLVKYFTLFFSMLDTGLFFMVGGVLFIAGGWYMEKKKAVLVQYMKNTHNENETYGG